MRQETLSRNEISSTHGVLMDLGEEITGIVGPVSLCMMMTACLVKTLNPDGRSNRQAVYLATAYYAEQEDDSLGKKVGGAVVNAAIFVSLIAALTLVLVLLFKKGYTKFIYGYMAFSGFSIFFMLTGTIAMQLVQKIGVHWDFPSFLYILFNYAAVGSITFFLAPAPLMLKQIYLINASVVVAYVFTWIPEWTTWTLLVAMAVYDVGAVLAPGGPLRLLIELAEERDEDIPALVYQARSKNPAGQCYSMIGAEEVDIRETRHNEGLEGQQRTPTDSDFLEESNARRRLGIAAAALPHNSPEMHNVRICEPEPQEEIRPAVVSDGAGTEMEHNGMDSQDFLPDGIKLGLGDFIFYSVLIGRAAMYDTATMFSCYIAIMAGLGCTLLFLVIEQRALPALPMSVTFAVVFYVLTRFVMEPVVLPMTLNLTYF